MTVFDEYTFKIEIVNKLRNADILSTTVRGVTTTTDNFVATASQTVFTLSNTLVKNIRSLTVAGVAKTYLFDYTVVWNTGVITLSTGATLSDAVVVNYDYGSSDKIYPDWPRDDLALDSYPRVSVMKTSTRTDVLGLGATSYMTDVIWSIFVFVPYKKVSDIAGGFGGIEDAMNLQKSIRQVVFNNDTSMYTIPYIKPNSINTANIQYSDKILVISQDCDGKFVLES